MDAMTDHPPHHQALRDVAYGPDPRHTLDLFLPHADRPTPLVTFLHGGGFREGDKKQLGELMLHRCLAHGWAVAAINYRLTDSGPFPLQHTDAARAIQFLRHHARRWNLNPQRVAGTGGSAGAGISLWLAFHRDLADPDADDPVLRQSTRLAGAAVWAAQATYDPRWIAAHVGGRAAEHPALPAFFGLPPEQWHTPEARDIFQRSAAWTYLDAGAPPVWALYREPDADLAADAKPGWGIHHPRFGHALQQRMQALGLACTIRHIDDYRDNAAAPPPPTDANGWSPPLFMDDLIAFLAGCLEADAAPSRKERV